MIRFILIILCLYLSACSDPNKNLKPPSIITVKPQTLKNSAFYSGIIQPFKTMVVSSPAEGTIDDMFFHYGDMVKKGQVLFTLNSDKFQADYKNALLQYIKTKTECSNAKSQMTESNFLFKHHLISEDDYKAKQTTFYTARLSLIQAEDTLTALTAHLDVPALQFKNLSIRDIDKINAALHTDGDSQKIKVLAPTTGMALLPVHLDSNETPKKIVKGDTVKVGDLLTLIGDVSGVSVHINVNEFNVNQVHLGQTVNITGSAFSEFNLQGKVVGIDRQGLPSQGGVPAFPVEVVVPTLTQAEAKAIHMGMSAKVELHFDSPNVIALPIAALFEKAGVPFVKLKKNSEIVEVPVKTGRTALNLVIIEANLQAGDQVVLPN
jgi:HlyD family secretion protein